MLTSRSCHQGGDEADYWNTKSVEHGAQSGLMLSFGGGHHMCTGRRFGFLQITTIWSVILRDFDLELISEVPLRTRLWPC